MTGDLEARVRDLARRHTTSVFATMLGVEVADADADVRGDAGGVVMALVGVTGPWHGTGVVSCSGVLARRLSGRMLLTDFDAVDADVLDAMGEIANMVIGNVKEELSPELGALAISTPTVVHGNTLHTRGIDGPVVARLAMACDGDVVDVRIALGPAVGTAPLVVEARR